MTKADLVEQVADAIGPGITKKDCALVVDGFLNAVKLALANGYSDIIDYRSEDVPTRIAELTNGEKCEAVYDSVGKDTLSESMKCLERRGI